MESEVDYQIRWYYCHLCVKVFKGSERFVQHKRQHLGRKTGGSPNQRHQEYSRRSHLEHQRSHYAIRRWDKTEQVKYVSIVNTASEGKAEFVARLNPTSVDNVSENSLASDKSLGQLQFALQHLRHPMKQASHITPSSAKTNAESASTYSQNSIIKRNKRAHAGKKLFTCHHCCNSFVNQKNLTAHIGTHIGETLFKCNFCSKGFSRQSSAIRHQHICTGEKPFSCQYCSASFSQKGQLTIHVRIHTGEKPFGCHHCGASFADKRNLARHTRTHTGEKPFKCNFCSKEFSQRSNVKQHQRVHTGEKSFSCHRCDASFAAKRALARHMGTHAG